MLLEHVWRVLEDGEWESKNALTANAGVDEDSVGLVIEFLARWDFIETRTSPTLLVRRKPGVVSPMEAFKVLSAVTSEESVGGLTSGPRRRVAERVACYACDCGLLKFVGENLVECSRCHERQWFAIEVGRDERMPRVTGRSRLKERLLDRLEFDGETCYW